MDNYINFHTHKLSTQDGVITVYNQLLHEETDIPKQLYSAGLHPWHADKLSAAELSRILDLHGSSSNLVALGETGLDKVCKIPIQLQQDIFELHLNKAVILCKPVIIHCVKAWEELLEITRHYHIPMILHGYNGSDQLTANLVKRGFYFSVGTMILNPNSRICHAINHIPISSIFCETDDSDLPVQSIYKAVGGYLKMKETDFKRAVIENFVRLRNNKKVHAKNAK
ncbi:MAG: TatD family hydrolase [Prolixibacteraceae bacterium]|jgi:TatD DNase family protein|nr:TatD family hydrolase [Prolixibacteraceae bacterium]